MNDILGIILIALVGFLCALTVSVLILQLRKPNNTNVDVSTPLQNLTQAIQDVRVQTASLTADFKARSDVERQTADSIRRLELIVAGSSSKGAAGERIVEELFSKLPTEWQAQNFRVGNKPVEFALRLPNNLILPIDSKWTATNLLEQFRNSTNIDEQNKLS
jgi:DNA anti-recombination protein RmuC